MHCCKSLILQRSSTAISSYFHKAINLDYQNLFQIWDQRKPLNIIFSLSQFSVFLVGADWLYFSVHVDFYRSKGLQQLLISSLALHVCSVQVR